MENAKEGKKDYMIIYVGTDFEKEVQIKAKIRFTPALADAVIPYYEELYKFAENASSIDEYKDMELKDGTVVSAKIDKLMKFNLRSIKPMNKDDAKTYNNICISIIKEIAAYNKNNEIYKKEIDSNSDSLFWQNQSINEIRNFVEFFRENNTFRI